MSDALLKVREVFGCVWNYYTDLHCFVVFYNGCVTDDTLLYMSASIVFHF